MNNAPVAPKAKNPKQYETNTKSVKGKTYEVKTKKAQNKQAKESHECKMSESFQTEVATSPNAEVKKTDIAKQEVEKLPFGIKTSQINKYIVYGEILATPACRKQRNRF